ncbi:MAG: hypothetical protein Q9159_003795 [Coniocarpon cinnabarinum]
MASAAAIPVLSDVLSSTLTLLTNATTALKSSSPTCTKTTSTSNTNASQALPLLKDTADLLHAHTTKLSLLLITPPFTASALATELHKVSTSVLPSMIASLDFADPSLLGSVMVSEMRSRVRRVMLDFQTLVEAIQTQSALYTSATGNPEKSAGASRKAGVNGMVKKETMVEKDKITSLTGVIWNSCTDLASLHEMGTTGLLLQKVSTFKTLVEDALSELKEWRDDDLDEGFSEADDDDVNDDEEGDVAASLGIQKLTLETPTSVRARDDVRELLNETVRLLGLLRSLYAAVIKYRVRVNSAPQSTQTPWSSEDVRRSDEFVGGLGRIPGEVDEIAGSLYEGDVDEAKKRIEDVKALALRVVRVSKRPLEGGEEDVFVSFCGKFEEALRGVCAERGGNG